MMEHVALVVPRSGPGGRSGRTAADRTVRRAFVVVVALVAAAPFPSSGAVVFAALAVGTVAVGFHVPLATHSGPVWALVLVMASSVFWSQDVANSVRAVTVWLLLLVFTCSCVAHMGLRDSLRAVLQCTRLLVAVGWIAYVALPQVGREQESYHFGAWTGLFIQRNNAAFVLAAAFLLSGVLLMSSRVERRRASSWGWAVATGVALVMCESGTGLAVSLGALGVAAVITLLATVPIRHRVAGASAFVTLLVGSTAVALRDFSTVLDLLGRDDTLTGRTVIWAAIDPVIEAHLLLGLGWGGVYTATSTVTQQVWALAGFEFPHGHNAFRDVLIQIGLVGLVVYVLLFGAVLRGAWVLYVRGAPRLTYTWPVVASIAMLVYAISEPSFTTYFGGVLLTVSVVGVTDHVAAMRDVAPAVGKHSRRATAGGTGAT